MDDRSTLTGIIHVHRNGLRWCDALAICGPCKTLWNRHVRWTRNDVFARMFTALAEAAGLPERIIIDSTHLWGTQRGSKPVSEEGAAENRTHQRWAELQARRRLRPPRPTRGAAPSRGQMSDHKVAGMLIDALPPASELTANRGYSSDGLRAALEGLSITPCIPTRKNREHPRPHDPALYRQHYPIESLFAKLKDRRRIATRYDRCADIFMGTVTLAATVILWIRK